MENSSKHIQLQTIVWPVYRLGEKAPVVDAGATFYYTEYIGEDGKTTAVTKVVDDLGISKPTLGRRRLELKKQGVKLHSIRTAIYFLADLIKVAKPTTWFIDSTGRVFQYKKNTRAKLVTKKIKQVLPAEGLGCVLEVEGLSQRFKSISRPDTYMYAVLLELNKSYWLYGLSDQPNPPSWRLI